VLDINSEICQKNVDSSKYMSEQNPLIVDHQVRMFLFLFTNKLYNVKIKTIPLKVIFNPYLSNKKYTIINLITQMNY